MNYKTKAAQYKKDEVNRLKSIIQNYQIIAVADMTNMPALQLQKMRSSLKNSVLITLSKSSLIKIAFDSLKEKINGLDQLKDHIRGMPALLLTNDSPFKLASVLKKSKSAAPAKGGQLAPNDIVVPAGPTAFPPGPIIGELGTAGVKATVVDGKITVKEDTIVVKEGQVIKQELANLLTRLGIEPMEIGINLLAALEKGVIYTKKVLTIDESEYLNNIKLAYQSAFNLAFNITYPTKDNIKLLLQKAFTESNALADSQNIMTSGNVKKILGKASLEAEALKSKLNLPEVDISTITESINPEEDKKKESIVSKEVITQKEEHKTMNNTPESQETKQKKEELTAQGILKQLQDEKIQKEGGIAKRDKNFEREEKAAQEAIRKAQDDKIKRS